MNREAIYSAFFELVRGVADFKTTERRWRGWAEVPPAEQPALFMAQVRETHQVVTKLPPVWMLHVELWVYVNSGSGVNELPATQLNGVLDALTNALMPPVPQGEQTLGGLVHRCRIDGEVNTDEGTFGDQAVAVIPVTIFVSQ